MKHMVLSCALALVLGCTSLANAAQMEPVCPIDNERTIEEAIAFIEALPEKQRDLNYAFMGRSIDRSGEEVRQLLLSGDYEEGFVAEDEAMLTFGFLPGRSDMGPYLRYGRGERAAYIDDVLVLSAGCCNASADHLYPRSDILELQAELERVRSSQAVVEEEENRPEWFCGWIHTERVVYHPTGSSNHGATIVTLAGHAVAWSHSIGGDTMTPMEGRSNKFVCQNVPFTGE